MLLDSEKIKKLLDNKGWSRQNLSRETGKFGKKVSVSTIGRPFKGQGNRPDNARLIAKGLGVSIDEIIEENQTKIAINQSSNPISIIDKDILGILREINEIKNRLDDLENKRRVRIKAKKGGT